MPKLEASFADVPDKFESIGVGTYKMKVLKCPLEPSKNPEILAKEPNATNMELEAEVIAPEGNRFVGRKAKRTISTKMLTEIKRLAMSSGIKKEQIEAEGLDTDLLPGREFYAEFVPNAYKDKNGVQRDGTQMNFLIPGDPNFASS